MTAQRTRNALINWGQGDANGAYLAAEILRVEGFQEIDLVHPQGGRDGKKDILCSWGGVKFVGACHFPNNSIQVTFNAIKRKFSEDLPGVKINNVNGFVFITNCEVSATERQTLEQIATSQGCSHCMIFHLERIRYVLDTPLGCSARLKYLDLEMSKEEQISFIEANRMANEAMVKGLLANHLQSVDKTIQSAIDQAFKTGGIAANNGTEQGGNS